MLKCISPQRGKGFKKMMVVIKVTPHVNEMTLWRLLFPLSLTAQERILKVLIIGPC